MLAHLLWPLWLLCGAIWSYAATLCFPDVGDIVETARLAKRIIDVLRNGGTSYKRQKIISALKGMHDDVAGLATVFDVNSLSPEVQSIVHRLSAELALCHSLMDKIYAKLHPSNAVLGRVWMVLSEEKELVSWRTDISECRDALHLLLELLNGLCVREAGEQLGQVRSQMQYIESGVNRVEARIQNVGLEIRNFGALTILGLIASNFVTDQISRIGSQVRIDVERMSLHDVSDPVFFVMDPLGRTITIQLSYCDSFKDLDRILKAHLHDRPQAGSMYVERGDYRILSTEGIIIPPVDFPGKLRAGMRFDLCILKRRRDWRKPTPHQCPYCYRLCSDPPKVGWIHCSNDRCGSRYQISSKKSQSAAEIEEIASLELSQQQDRKELFRLIEIQAIYTTLYFFLQHSVGKRFTFYLATYSGHVSLRASRFKRDDGGALGVGPSHNIVIHSRIKLRLQSITHAFTNHFPMAQSRQSHTEGDILAGDLVSLPITSLRCTRLTDVEVRLAPLVAFPLWVDPHCQPIWETPSRFLMFYLPATQFLLIPQVLSPFLFYSCPGPLISQVPVILYLPAQRDSTAIKNNVTASRLEDGHGARFGLTAISVTLLLGFHIPFVHPSVAILRRTSCPKPLDARIALGIDPDVAWSPTRR
ncbi:hypothetical protein DFH08DRAFT_822324 [Mycena albidolilacea]|uniref:Ubiquitin-like domain-containing protein n=1 Tax=Mycena albidolilacea TaxID=1033008 RepID=A0AAD7ECR2_9AGAR|nr:hypothetical protein DFH08DRAFT_822324 [Mycena albidolilacea]